MAHKKQPSRRYSSSKQTQVGLHERTNIDSMQDFKASKVEFFLAKIFYIIRSHSRQAVLAFFVGLISLLIIISYYAWAEVRDEKSLLAFQDLLKEPTMNLSSGAPAIAVEKLQEYRKKFSHTNARIRSMIYEQQYLEKDKKVKQAGELCLEIAPRPQNA